MQTWFRYSANTSHRITGTWKNTSADCLIWHGPKGLGLCPDHQSKRQHKGLSITVPAPAACDLKAQGMSGESAGSTYAVGAGGGGGTDWNSPLKFSWKQSNACSCKPYLMTLCMIRHCGECSPGSAVQHDEKTVGARAGHIRIDVLAPLMDSVHRGYGGVHRAKWNRNSPQLC